MAGVNREEYKKYNPSFVIIFAVEIIIGILFNGFIISVVLRDFVKTKIVSSSFKILLSLGIANVFFDLIMSIGLLDYFYCLGIFARSDTAYIFLFLCLFSLSTCAWLTANISSFYFINISNFKSEFFVWIKRKVIALVPWILLVDIVLSLCSSFLASLIIVNSEQTNSTDYCPTIITELMQLNSAIVATLTADTIIPFLVIFVTTVSTITTLAKHSHKMGEQVQTPAADHRKAYEKIVCRMMYSLMFYGGFYPAVLILYIVVLSQLQSKIWLLIIIASSYSPVQSVLLVLANPRLMEALREPFLCIDFKDTLRT
ncbi:taste receptor type 2 member 13-like [Hyperolius riggenbachi]|uniref:taste receptor type 2 member 13-like n=1 Tax=Hyperolius riggenbachi TaxID=752182 RepID=UPI0035A37E2A